MNKNRILFVLFLIAVSSFLYIGCKKQSVVYLTSDSTGAGSSSIKGSVRLPVLSYSLRLSSHTPETIPAQQAKVWIEEFPEHSTTTDENGNFYITGLVAGTHRYVSELVYDAKIFINKSDYITLEAGEFIEDENPLILLEANNVCKGFLFDKSGKPLPANIVCSIWGKECSLNKNTGQFETPPLPDLEGFDAINYLTINLDSHNKFKLPLSFFMNHELESPDLKVTISADNLSLSPPKAALLPLINGKINTEVKVSGQIEIFALIEPETAEIATWTASHGSLSPFTKSGTYKKSIWTAPDTAVNSAELTLLVTNDNLITMTSTRLKVKGEFKVAFNSNGGTLIEPQIIPFNQKVSKPQNPTLEGYSFDAWYTTSTYTKKWNFESDLIKDDTTLYAKWRKKSADAFISELLLFADQHIQYTTPPFEKLIASYTLPLDHETTELTLCATTSSDIASIKINSLTIQNGASFTINLPPPGVAFPLMLEVTAEDSSTMLYQIDAIRSLLPSTKKILRFAFNEFSPPVIGIIDHLANNIELTVPYGTTQTTFIPTITHSGKSVAPPSNEPYDFSEPVAFFVEALDESVARYFASVQVASNPAKEIINFHFAELGPDLKATIDNKTGDIIFEVPFGTIIGSFTPIIAYNAASITPENREKQDFSKPVTYLLTAEDQTTKEYRVSITTLPNDKNLLNSFSFFIYDKQFNATIDQKQKTVLLELPFATDLSSLVASFTLSENAIAKIDSTLQTSGVTQNDFSDEVMFKVFAQDGSLNEYSIKVSLTDTPKIISNSTLTNGHTNPTIVLNIFNTTFKDESYALDPNNYILTFPNDSFSLDRLKLNSPTELTIYLNGKMSSGSITITIKREAINALVDTNTLIFSADNPIIETSSTLVFYQRDPELLISLQNAFFNNDESVYDTANYIFSSTSALQLSHITKIDDTQIKIHFTGLVTEGTTEIIISQDAISAANDTNSLKFSVDRPIIFTSSSIAFRELNPTLTVYIENALFNYDTTSIDINNYELSGSTGLELTGIIFESQSQITLVLAGVATTGDLHFKAKSGAINAISDTNKLTINVPLPPKLVVSSPIPFGSVNPNLILNLQNANFNSDLSATADYNILIFNNTTGLIVSSITRLNDTQLSILFSGTAIQGQISFLIRSPATNAIIDTNAASLAINQPLISATELAYLQENPTLTLTLENAIFNDKSLAEELTHYSIIDNGTSLELTKVTKISDTQVTLLFSGIAKQGNISILVKSNAISAFSDSNPCNVVIKLPLISTQSIITNGQNNPSILLKLDNTSFNTDASAYDVNNYLFVSDESTLSLSSVTIESSTQALLTFSGVAHTAVVSICAKKAAISAFADTNIINLEILDPSITSTSSISYAQINPKIEINLENSTFNADGTSTFIDNYIIMGSTGLSISNIELTSPQQMIIHFSGTAKAGTLSVKILEDAISAIVDTNTIEFDIFAPTIKTNSSIAHGQKNPNVSITLEHADFLDDQSTLDISNYNFVPGDTGLDLSSILRLNKNQVMLKCVGTATTGSFSITVSSNIITAISNTNTLPIKVGDPPLITSSSTIQHGQTNTVILLNLENAQFNNNDSATTLENYIVDPSTTNLELIEVIKNSPTKVLLTFSGTADFGNISIAIRGAAITSVTDTNTVILSVPNAPIITSDSKILYGEVNPVIDISLKNATFVDGTAATNPNHYEIIDDSTGLTISKITKLASEQVSVEFLGTANTGNIQLKIKGLALTSVTDSNSISFEVAKSPLIHTDSQILLYQNDPSIVINLQNAEFKDSAESLSPANYQIVDQGTGLSLTSVTKQSASQVTLHFSGSANSGSISLTVRSDAITSAANTNEISLSIAGPLISTTSTIIFYQLNPTVLISLQNAQFNADGSETSLSHYSVTGDSELTLASVVKLNPNQVILSFAGNAKAGSLNIEIKAPAINTVVNTNTITFTINAPTINSASEILHGQPNPSIIINLKHAKFYSDGSETMPVNYIIATGTTALSLSSISRLGDQQILFQFSGTALAGTVSITATKTAIDAIADTNALTLTVNEAPIIHSDSDISTGQHNPTLLVELSNAYFKADGSATNNGNYVLTPNTTALSISSVVFISSSQVMINLTGIAQEGALQLKVRGAAITAVSDTNTITLPVKGAPIISSVSSIKYWQVNPTVIIDLENAKFNNDHSAEDPQNYLIKINNANIQLDSLTRLNESQVLLNFSGKASNGTVEISIKQEALSGFIDSNSIVLTIFEAPIITTTSTLLHGQPNPIIILELQNAVFNSNGSETNPANYIISESTTGLILSSIIKNSDTRITLNFSGNTSQGELEIGVRSGAIDAFIDTNLISFELFEPLIESDSEILHGQPNPTISLVLTNAVFNDDQSSTNTANYIIDEDSTSLTLNTVAKISDSQVDLRFIGIAQTGNLKVAIKSAAISVFSNTNQLVFPISNPPHITTTSTIAHGQTNPAINIKLENATFNNDESSTNLSNYQITQGSTSLVPETVQKLSDNSVKLTFNGTANAGELTIIIKQSAISVFSDTNQLNLVVSDSPQLTSDTPINNGDSNPNVTLTLFNANFNDDGSETNLNNYQIALGTTELTPASITRISNSKVTIHFSGICVAGTIEIIAKGAATTAVSDSNELSFLIHSPKITSESIIQYGQKNPPVTLELAHSTFNADSSVFETSNYYVNDQQTSLSIAHITRNSDTQISLTLSGTADSGYIEIGVKQQAIYAADDSNILRFDVPIAPNIETDSTILHAQANPSIVINLKNATFNNDNTEIDPDNYTLTEGGTHLNIASIIRSDDTQVIVYLSGTADEGLLKLLIKAAAISSHADTNQISISVLKPILSSKSTIPNAQSAPLVVLDLQNATFNADASATDLQNYTVSYGTTGINLSSVTRNSSTQVTLSFSGISQGGVLVIAVLPNAIDAFSQTNPVEIIISDTPQITSNSSIAFGEQNPEIMLQLSNALFNDDLSSTDTANYIINDLATSLTLAAVVKNTSDSVTLKFSGTANTGEIEVTVKANAITAMTNTNTIKFEVANAPVITSLSNILNGELNPSILISLANAQFNEDGSAVVATNYILEPGETNLAIDSVESIDSNQIKIYLSGKAATGEFELSVSADAITAASDTNKIKITIKPPIISTDGSIIEYYKPNPTLNISLENSLFEAPPLSTDVANYHIVDSASSLVLDKVDKITDTQVLLTFAGIAKTGTIEIKAKKEALISDSDTNSVSVLIADPPVISCSSQILHGEKNPSIILDITNAIFRDGFAIDTDNYNFTGGTTNLSLASILKESDTQVRLLLIGTSSEGEVSLSVKAPAITAYDTTNTLLVEVKASVLSSISPISYAQPDPIVVLHIANANFNNDGSENNVANYILIDEGTGLTLSGTVRNSDTQITLNLSGTAQTGTLQLAVKHEATNVFADTNFISFHVPEAPIILTDSYILYGQPNPAIKIELLNAHFKTDGSEIIASNYSLTPDTTTLAINNIVKISPTEVIMNLSGNALSGTASFFVKPAAISAFANTNTLELSVPLAPIISCASAISNATPDPSIEIFLENAQFNNDGSEINISNYNFDSGATALALDSITRLSDTEIKVNFVGIAAAGSFELSIGQNAITAFADTNAISLLVGAPTISTTSKIAHGQPNPELVIELANAEFNDDLTSENPYNYYLDYGTTSLTLNKIQRLSATQVLISLMGISQEGTIQISVDEKAISSTNNTNNIFWNVPSAPQIISDSSIINGETNPTVSLTLLHAIFNDDISGITLANYEISGDTGLALGNVSLVSPTSAKLTFSGEANEGELIIKVLSAAIDSYTDSNQITIIVGPSPLISTNSTLAHGQISPSLIIQLANAQFVDDEAVTNLANYEFDPGTTQLSVGNIKKNSPSQITINLFGTAQEGTIQIIVKPGAINIFSNSNSLPVSVPAAPVIESPTQIAYGEKNPAILINLQNAEFKNDGSAILKSNYYFAAQTTGLSISDIVRNSNQQVKINLLGTAIQGTIQLYVRGAAITAVSNTNSIEFIVPAAPVIFTEPMIPYGQPNPEIILTLENAEFVQGLPATDLSNYIFNDSGTTLSMLQITRDTDTQVSITLSGTAQTGSISIGVKQAAITAAADSNSLLITVPNPPTLTTASQIAHGQEDPTITLTLSNATFNDDGSPNSVANYIIDGATTLNLSSAAKITNTEVSLTFVGIAQSGELKIKVKQNAISALTDTNFASIHVPDAPHLTSTSEIVHGQLNPTIILTLENASFNSDSSAENIANYAFYQDTTGLSLNKIKRLSSTQVRAELTGTSNTGTIQIAAKMQTFNAFTDTNYVSVSVPDAPLISTPAVMAHGDTAVTIQLILENAKFNDDVSAVNLANYQISHGTTGLSLSSVTRNNDNMVTLAFNGTAKGGQISIRVLGAAITAVSSTNTIYLTVPNAPIIRIATPIALGQKNPPIIIELQNATFNNDSSVFDLNNYYYDAGSTGLVIHNISRVSDTEIEITFSGTASSGSFDLSIAGLAISAITNTNLISYLIGAASISSNSSIFNGALNPSIIIELANAQFKEDGSEIDLANYLVSAGTTHLSLHNVLINTPTKATLEFLGTAENGELSLLVKKAAITSLSDTNSLAFYISPKPIINSDAFILHGDIDPEIIINLQNAEFNSDLSSINRNNYSVEGIGLELNLVTIINATQAKLSLVGEAIAGELEVKVKKEAITANRDTNLILIPVGLNPKILTTSSLEHNQIDPVVDLTLENAYFKTEGPATVISNYIIDEGTSELELAYITCFSQTQVSLHFFGKAMPGTLQITVKHNAIDSSKNTNTLEIEIEERDYYSDTLGVIKYVGAGQFLRNENPNDLSIQSKFRMSENLITQQQFMDVTGLPNPSYFNDPDHTNYPVENVNWYHTLVFCNKLSMLESLTPCYSINGSTDPDDWGEIPSDDDATWDSVSCDWSANGYRLPTEMQWWWAAMGGLKDKREDSVTGVTNFTGYNKAFAGSSGENSILNYVWYNLNNLPIGTKEVGTKMYNELQIYDLSGNTWEWVWDAYDTLPSGTIEDYKGSEASFNRIVRGGFFNSPPQAIALNERTSNTPSHFDNNKGFRVVRP